ncbi:MAG: hypothetical protein RL033_1496 [Pseudomonadota bacterium]
MVDAMPGTSKTGGDICDRQRAEIGGQVVSGTLSIQEACAQHQLSPELLLEWVATFRQSSLTAFDEQVRRTLADQGVDVSTLTSAEFQGDLDQFTIADLIQTLAFGQRDAILTVAQAGSESRIWCIGGEIADAECGKLTGIAAVYRMLALEQGRVRASFHRVHRPRRVHASIMQVLLEGARRSDECRLLRARLGSGLYRPSPAAASTDLSRSAVESALLSLFEAPRDIVAALAESTWGDLETLTLIVKLVAQGWLVPADEAHRPAPERWPSPVNSQPPIVLSLARLATQRPAPHLRQGLVLGLALCGLALWLMPRYLSAFRETELSLPVRPAAAPIEPTALAPMEPIELAPIELAPIEPRAEPPSSAPALDPPRSTSSPLARAVPRRRISRASAATPPAPSRAPGTAPVPAARADATSLGVEPRMQLIEARNPQMQIVE